MSYSAQDHITHDGGVGDDFTDDLLNPNVRGSSGNKDVTE
jgi:hypothetical protein